MHRHAFCIRRQCADPVLKMYDDVIPVVDDCNFLGVHFDKKLRFKTHLTYVKNRCLKALNLLKVVAARGLGADRQTKLMMYRALVRSKLDYGSIVYGSARPSYLKCLETVQNQGLRMCLNAFRTTNADSMRVEAAEPPIALRQLKLSMNYVLKVRSDPSNPTHSMLSASAVNEKYEQSDNAIRPLRLRVHEHCEFAGIDFTKTIDRQPAPVPPWKIRLPSVDLSLSVYSKKFAPPDALRSAFLELKSRYDGYTFVYTDGSKCDEKTASGFVYDGASYSTRLTDNSSIFTAEIYAILSAIKRVKISETKRFFAICSDSLSVLQSLQNHLIQNPLVVRVLYELSNSHDRTIVFIWVPSHVGIVGNELADAAAKNALSRAVTDVLIPYTDYRPLVHQHIMDLWRHDWSKDRDNKLHRVGADVGQSPPLESTIRDDTVIRRLRLGHTRFSHSYLLRGEPKPFCHTCNRSLSVRHVLIECSLYARERIGLFNAASRRELFTNTTSDVILQFMHRIRLYDQV